MEPSSTNSSDRTHVDSHELEQYPLPQPSRSLQPGNATPGRARVRINSVAAEIPPPPPVQEHSSSSHISEAESLENNDDDQTVAAAEQLLKAHNAGNVVTEHFNHDDPFDDSVDEGYAVTGNTQGGVFYQLLQAYKNPLPAYNDIVTPSEPSNSSPPTAQRPGSSSGAATPSRKKWYHQEKAAQSQETLATLIGASAKLANPNDKKEPPSRPHHKRTGSGGGILAKVIKAKEDQDVRIKIHVANILKRQQYIIRMCRALMLFGAPTHRLEEYLATTAKVLEINSQFLYIPGCMLISFDDALTHTVKLPFFARSSQRLMFNRQKLRSCVPPRASTSASSKTLTRFTKKYCTT
jgi:hypothetical protein